MLLYSTKRNQPGTIICIIITIMTDLVEYNNRLVEDVVGMPFGLLLVKSRTTFLKIGIEMLAGINVGAFVC
jgi:hypothetical protein